MMPAPRQQNVERYARMRVDTRAEQRRARLMRQRCRLPSSAAQRNAMFAPVYAALRARDTLRVPAEDAAASRGLVCRVVAVSQTPRSMPHDARAAPLPMMRDAASPPTCRAVMFDLRRRASPSSVQRQTSPMMQRGKPAAAHAQRRRHLPRRAYAVEVLRQTRTRIVAPRTPRHAALRRYVVSR
jgi:hypothetical protein